MPLRSVLMATYAVLRELSDEPDELDSRLGFDTDEDEADQVDEVENQRRRRMLLGIADVTVA